jgi:cation-transporting ATPase 13A3/4/5
MLVVLFSSAFSAIAIRRANQQTLQKMTEYATICDTKRDGVWVQISSHELVPGDLVRIAGDWTLPCDFLLLSGTAVVDESGLTGESRPVRKAWVPAAIGDGTAYSSHDHSKHTLFAGTRTLQAGGVQEVLALVTATATKTAKGQLVTHILFPRKMHFKYDEELPIALGGLFLYAIFWCA